MWVISKRTLREFWTTHADAEARLRAWYQVVNSASWSNVQEVKATFPAADLVGRLMVFNVGGKNYRIIARVEFGIHKVFIRYVLTHAEYSTDAWKKDPWF